MVYTQLDNNNICVGISDLSGEVPEYNYSTTNEFDPITGTMTESDPVFVSRMIKVDTYSENYIGLHYMENGKWERAE